MASRASLPRLPAQVAAVRPPWVATSAAVAVSISAAALRDLGLVPAAARLGLGLAAAVAALLRHSSAVAVAADMVAATAVTTIIVAAAASFPARWPVL